MPDGGQPLNVPLRRALARARRPLPSASSSPAWLTEIGIATEVSRVRRHPAHRRHRRRRVRPVRVGLDAVRRPRPDAELLHLRAGHHRRRQPVGYNDANWCSRGVRRAVRRAEPGARPRQARRDRARDDHDVLHRVAPTWCSTTTPTRRPTAPTASRAGCSSPPTPARCCSPTSSPTYFNLTPDRRRRWRRRRHAAPALIIAHHRRRCGRDRWRSWLPRASARASTRDDEE